MMNKPAGILIINEFTSIDSYSFLIAEKKLFRSLHVFILGEICENSFLKVVTSGSVRWTSIPMPKYLLDQQNHDIDKANQVSSALIDIISIQLSDNNKSENIFFLCGINNFQLAKNIQSASLGRVVTSLSDMLWETELSPSRYSKKLKVFNKYLSDKSRRGLSFLYDKREEIIVKSSDSIITLSPEIQKFIKQSYLVDVHLLEKQSQTNVPKGFKDASLRINHQSDDTEWSYDLVIDTLENSEDNRLFIFKLLNEVLEITKASKVLIIGSINLRLLKYVKIQHLSKLVFVGDISPELMFKYVAGTPLVINLTNRRIKHNYHSGVNLNLIIIAKAEVANNFPDPSIIIIPGNFDELDTSSKRAVLFKKIKEVKYRKQCYNSESTFAENSDPDLQRTSFREFIAHLI